MDPLDIFVNGYMCEDPASIAVDGYICIEVEIEHPIIIPSPGGGGGGSVGSFSTSYYVDVERFRQSEKDLKSLKALIGIEDEEILLIIKAFLLC